MQIQGIEIEGYRSLRDLTTKLDWLTVLVGPNGVGKSNLYRALELLQLANEQRLAHAVASEGGMKSLRWAGSKKPGSEAKVRILVRWDELEYELEIGMEKESSGNPFVNDPFVRRERIWSKMGRRVELIRRGGPQLDFRDDEGHWRTYPHNLGYNESMLSLVREPGQFPAMLQVRNAIAGWRFFHTFRTDFESPLRRPQPTYRTNMLEKDGSNLVAALLSIKHSRNSEALSEVVRMALPDFKLRIPTVGNSGALREIATACGTFHPDRLMRGAELSDGTLRIFALAAALLSEDAPEFLVLNEPETSLHPSTFPALAYAINIAAQRSQILIVSHSQELGAAITRLRPARVRTLRWDQVRGTRIDSQVRINEPADYDESEFDDATTRPGNPDRPSDDD